MVSTEPVGAAGSRGLGGDDDDDADIGASAFSPLGLGASLLD